MTTPGLLAWLVAGHPVSLRILERNISAEMANLRAATTPAQRAEVEKRLIPLVRQRRDILAGMRGREAA